VASNYRIKEPQTLDSATDSGVQPPTVSLGLTVEGVVVILGQTERLADLSSQKLSEPVWQLFMKREEKKGFEICGL
jgi:hypothetical protein